VTDVETFVPRLGKTKQFLMVMGWCVGKSSGRGLAELLEIVLNEKGQTGWNVEKNGCVALG